MSATSDIGIGSPLAVYKLCWIAERDGSDVIIVDSFDGTGRALEDRRVGLWVRLNKSIG